MKPFKVPACILAILISLATVTLLLLLQRLVMPKYQETLLEGALIEEYYGDEQRHDLVFFGDCEVYESFSPAVLEDETGLKSFIRGSASQRIWQSYYLMEETISYEKPDIFVFNILAMKYGDPVKEEYNRMTLDGMRWSLSKFRSILASLGTEEHVIEYLFPLLRYHSRWSNLTSEDFTYLFRRNTVSDHGYFPQPGVKPADNVPSGKPLADYSFPAVCFEYLDKMTKLCESNDIQLILVKAPVLYPYWYPEWESQMKEYADKNDLIYWNMLEQTEAIGIDYTVDTPDAGLSLNDKGAEKLTRYFADRLKSEVLPDIKENKRSKEVLP